MASSHILQCFPSFFPFCLLNCAPFSSVLLRRLCRVPIEAVSEEEDAARIAFEAAAEVRVVVVFVADVDSVMCYVGRSIVCIPCSYESRAFACMMLLQRHWCSFCFVSNMLLSKANVYKGDQDFDD